MRRVPTLLLPIAMTTLIASAIAGTAPLDTSWPGSTPELFAPGVVNTDGVEINLVFDRDTTELFFARTVDKVFFVYTSRLVDGTWTAPERLKLYPEGVRAEAVDMALSPDEQSLYFLGITPEGETTQSDIWVSERTDGGWSLARRLGPSVNTEHSEFYPTVVADGSLYFVSDRPSELGPRNLYRSARRADGSFEPAIPIGPPIDTEQRKGDTFVEPDETPLGSRSFERIGEITRRNGGVVAEDRDRLHRYKSRRVRRITLAEAVLGSSSMTTTSLSLNSGLSRDRMASCISCFHRSASTAPGSTGTA